MAVRKSSLTLARAILLIESAGGKVVMPKPKGRPRSWHRSPEGRAALKRLYDQLRERGVAVEDAQRAVCMTFGLSIRPASLPRIIYSADVESRG